MPETLLYTGAGAWNEFFIFIVVAWIVALIGDTAILTVSGWKNFNDAFGDAFIANVASAGAFLILFSGGLFSELSEPLFYTLIPFNFVLIEGILLNSRRGQNSKLRAWILAAGMNAATSLLIAVFFLILRVI